MNPVRDPNITRVSNGVKILIAAGGSGGHIFPSIAFARALAKERPQTKIKFVGSQKVLDRRIFEKEGLDFVLISANTFPYKPSFRTIVFFAKLFADLIKCFFIVAFYRPDAIVGFGGYVPCPVILIGRLLGIPGIVHEQNVVPGRANTSMFGIVDRIALSFEETVPLIGKLANKAVITGNPIRTEDFLAASIGSREALLKRLGLGGSKFTILVIGGSQGAHLLNETFIEAISKMDDAARSSMQVIHITGVKDYGRACAAYRDMGLESRVFSFIDKIEEAYGASDIVVTRAGASAIFELAFFAKPMILVPYPFAMSHQLDNALAFSKKGAAIIIEEKQLSVDIFMDNIISLYRDKNRREGLSQSARRMSAPEASRELARQVLKLVGDKDVAR